MVRREAHSPFLSVPLPDTARYSERTAQAIDAEVRRILSEAPDRVRQTLTSRRSTLDALAGELLALEVVERLARLELMAAQSKSAPGAAARE